ncbi:hypothetical protein BG006_006831 [Podila minutissima]|uniref:Peptidase family M13 n=1 Tax=Podila minutissima TaxID=64525 RepID=A0A9P5SI15_9FUNG|nr:hypothetical protein BG006_006831 [Podila minutissima]
MLDYDAQGFYKSYMNETRITEVGCVTLFKELEELVTTVFPVQGSSLISHFPNIAPLVDLLNITDRERLTSAITHLYWASTLSILNFYSFPDERNPEIQILWISRGDSVIPDPVLLERTPLLAEYRKAIEKIYTFVFGKSEGATKFANDMIAFETKIVNFADGADASPYITAADLNELYPSLDWPLLLQKILHGTNITLDRELKNDFPPYTYFAWETIIARSRALPTQYRRRINRTMSILDGDVNPDAVPDRWSICVDSTSTHFASIVGHFCISQMFPSATKNQVQSMVGTIREAYRTDFQALGWLDNSTHANAITKLDAMIELIGYFTADPNVGSAEAHEKYYAAVHIKDSEYYSNLVQAKAQILKKMLYRSAPYFTANTPECLNFGALGMITGHEIAHGFDNFDRNYGPRGELHDYSNFTVMGPEGETLYVNGEQTVGENISNNGGIKMAFMAWAKRFASDRDSRPYNYKLLPGRGVSHLMREQLFFLSFGQSWCRLGTPTYFANQVRDGVHAPNHARVLGTMQNAREFARAFKCKTDSPMDPVSKCEIW